MFISRGDHCYGLGGVSITAAAPGVTARFATVDHELGRAVTSFEAYYLTQPGGGSFLVEIDGVPRARVSTDSDQTRSAFHRAEVDEATA